MTDFDLQQQLLAQRRDRFAGQREFRSPQGQMVGRHFVAPNALQFLAEGLRSYGGIRGQEMAEKELTELSGQRKQATADALRRFGEQAQGRPADMLPPDQAGPVRPAQAPDMQGAFAALMEAPDAGLRQTGMQGIVQAPQLEAQAAERAAQRDFQRQQAELQNQQRMEQLRQQHDMRMEALSAQNASRADMMAAQQQFQREMTEARRSMQSQPQAFYQPIQTAQGVFAFNARTGQMEAVSGPDGRPVVGAQADPALQGAIAGSKAASTEANKRVVESGMDAPQAIQQAQTSIKLIDEVLSHPGFKTSVGAERILPLRMIPGTVQSDFESRLGQIQGQSFLQAFESLKGGGAITEVEGQKATQAINRMSAATSEKEFRTAASDLQNILRQGVARSERSQNRLQNNLPAGVNLSAQPQAAQPAMPSGFKVVR